jgi:hypothetical protein
MAVPEEILHRLSQWCAARVPGREREHRQISYAVHGTDVTIHDRRPPEYPELGSAWSATPIAQLRLGTEGRWKLYRPADGAWRQDGNASEDPIALLDRLR